VLIPPGGGRPGKDPGENLLNSVRYCICNSYSEVPVSSLGAHNGGEVTGHV
jgi:hypothetical protein